MQVFRVLIRGHLSVSCLGAQAALAPRREQAVPPLLVSSSSRIIMPSSATVAPGPRTGPFPQWLHPVVSDCIEGWRWKPWNPPHPLCSCVVCARPCVSCEAPHPVPWGRVHARGSCPAGPEARIHSGFPLSPIYTCSHPLASLGPAVSIYLPDDW